MIQFPILHRMGGRKPTYTTSRGVWTRLTALIASQFWG